MDFFVDSRGEILRVTPAMVAQGSANAEIIRFIGAFPSSSVVTVAYTLPTGDNTIPMPMTYIGTVDGTKDEDGATFSVWEIPLGVKYDANGEAIPDYNITAHYGTVNVQFSVKGINVLGKPCTIASPLSSFIVQKGVPGVYSYDPANLGDIQSTLDRIYADLFYIRESFPAIQGLLTDILGV